jgi:hypothetical protein
MNLRKHLFVAAITIAVLAAAGPAAADVIMTWDSLDGFSATAVFNQTGARDLELTVTNTSTAWPADLEEDTSNQFLTSISFELGNGVEITGGTATLGENAYSINFDNVPSQLGEGDDASGEWGFGNTTQNTGLARNFVTANQAHATPFGGGNLDGPSNLSGPQGGLLADPPLIDVGGLGGIAGPVVFNLTLSDDWDIAGLATTGATIEFGSDAKFLFSPQFEEAPEPATLALLAMGATALTVGSWRGRKRSSSSLQV